MVGELTHKDCDAMSTKINLTTHKLLKAFKELRVEKEVSAAELDDTLNMGPGWVSRIETGQSVPTIDILLSMVSGLGATPNELFYKLDDDNLDNSFRRGIYATPNGSNLKVHFLYTQFDAVYELANASCAQFDQVIICLRKGLAKTKTAPNNNNEDSQTFKMDAVASAFMTAIKLWPNANPSDLWWFIIYRAYCDPFNHPASFARLNFTESWKRTSGWALEKILVDFYAPILAAKGIEICMPSAIRKPSLLSQLKTSERLESDKVDVCLVGKHNNKDVCFGVVHVKASFAERRTDDVPMSQSLVKAGYVSPLWTMDCKSPPGEKPVNKGELGKVKEKGADRRSAKRKDIEDDGYFSACFSYNTNTISTPASQSCHARIHVCTFKATDNTFVDFIDSSWKKFKAGL